MTPAVRFLWALRARGVRLWVEDGQLRYDAPQGAITAEDRAMVPAVKADLLRLLTEPCDCGACTQGEEPHDPRCACPACLDAKAAAKADAEYEAEERLAILEEGCTPAEFEALKMAKETIEATVAATPEPVDAGSPPEKLGPWSWVDSESSREELAILRSIERLEDVATRETAESSCYGCGGRDWWRARIGGHLICRRCHPPAPSAEATP